MRRRNPQAIRAPARGSAIIITTTPDDITAGTVDITTAGITAGNLRRQDITSSAIYPQAGQVFQHLNIGRARGRGFPSLRPRSLELQLRLTNLAGPNLASDIMSGDKVLQR